MTNKTGQIAVSAKAKKQVNIKSPADAVALGELGATAICGNDISSSCLYVSALSIV